MTLSRPTRGQLRALLSGGRGLAYFWATVALGVVLTCGVLQALGPVTSPPVRLAQRPSPDHVRHPPGRETPGPDPAISGSAAAAQTPPASAYAAGFDTSTPRPRVGLLIAGIGMSEADSLAAINTLPAGVTLAVSPYAANITTVIAAARLKKHEYLLSLPMEPLGYPANDPDDRYALMTSVPPAENLDRLQALLARASGFVGVTNALGPMRGERLAAMTIQFDPVLEEIAKRGLIFVDARADHAALPRVRNRSADIVLDEDPLDAQLLDQRLDTLTHVALDKGSALGIVSAPRPMTVERIAAWTNTLALKGLALAPVSALMLPPAKHDGAQ